MDEQKQEITNAVIATKLDGFKELTDTKFKNVEEALKRIELSNTTFATKAELDEVKKDFNATIGRIQKGFEQHNLDDKESFGGLNKGQAELRDTIKLWAGGLAIIAVSLPFIAPLVFHFWFKF